MGKKKERLPKLPDFNKRIISHSVDSMTKDAIEKLKRTPKYEGECHN